MCCWTSSLSTALVHVFLFCVLPLVYHAAAFRQIEGKVSVRLCPGKDGENRQLTVGCKLPGKWILHWGVTYADDVGRYRFMFTLLAVQGYFKMNFDL